MRRVLLAGAASFVSASFVVRRARLPSRRTRAVVGVIALALLLAAEGTLVLTLGGQSLADHIASRDPITGTAYLVSLALFAAAPGLVRAR